MNTDTSAQPDRLVPRRHHGLHLPGAPPITQRHPAVDHAARPSIGSDRSRALPGSWSDGPAVSFAYQWLRGASDDPRAIVVDVPRRSRADVGHDSSSCASPASKAGFTVGDRHECVDHRGSGRDDTGHALDHRDARRRARLSPHRRALGAGRRRRSAFQSGRRDGSPIARGHVVDLRGDRRRRRRAARSGDGDRDQG